MKNRIDYFLVGNRPIIARIIRGVPASVLGYCFERKAFEALPHLMNDVNSLDCQKLNKVDFIAICSKLDIEPPINAI